MRSDVIELAVDLIARREPFVVGTVVWRRGPSSGKLGGQLLVTADGKVHGWLGGACAEPTVVREALLALTDGGSRLMFLGPEEELDANHRDGVTLVPMACESEGALEVYLEPTFPKPHVVVVGRSPAADLLSRLVRDLGWKATLVDDGGDTTNLDEEHAVLTSLDGLGGIVDAATFIVVMTQGHYDEKALEAALRTDAPYVGLVASRKRADSVREYLRGSGLDHTDIDRVTAPAGLDLGSIDHDEIAVAVLAELVVVRSKLDPVGAATVATITTAVDPVCGMDVDIASAKFTHVHAGETYYFCAAGCQRAFERSPHDFLAGTGAGS